MDEVDPTQLGVSGEDSREGEWLGKNGLAVQVNLLKMMTVPIGRS